MVTKIWFSKLVILAVLVFVDAGRTSSTTLTTSTPTANSTKPTSFLPEKNSTESSTAEKNNSTTIPRTARTTESINDTRAGTSTELLPSEDKTSAASVSPTTPQSSSTVESNSRLATPAPMNNAATMKIGGTTSSAVSKTAAPSIIPTTRSANVSESIAESKNHSSTTASPDSTVESPSVAPTETISPDSRSGINSSTTTLANPSNNSTMSTSGLGLSTSSSLAGNHKTTESHSGKSKNATDLPNDTLTTQRSVVIPSTESVSTTASPSSIVELPSLSATETISQDSSSGKNSSITTLANPSSDSTMSTSGLGLSTSSSLAANHKTEPHSGKSKNATDLPIVTSTTQRSIAIPSTKSVSTTASPSSIVETPSLSSTETISQDSSSGKNSSITTFANPSSDSTMSTFGLGLSTSSSLAANRKTEPHSGKSKNAADLPIVTSTTQRSIVIPSTKSVSTAASPSSIFETPSLLTTKTISQGSSSGKNSSITALANTSSNSTIPTTGLGFSTSSSPVGNHKPTESQSGKSNNATDLPIAISTTQRTIVISSTEGVSTPTSPISTVESTSIAPSESIGHDSGSGKSASITTLADTSRNPTMVESRLGSSTSLSLAANPKTTGTRSGKSKDATDSPIATSTTRQTTLIPSTEGVSITASITTPVTLYNVIPELSVMSENEVSRATDLGRSGAQDLTNAKPTTRAHNYSVTVATAIPRTTMKPTGDVTVAIPTSPTLVEIIAVTSTASIRNKMTTDSASRAAEAEKDTATDSNRPKIQSVGNSTTRAIVSASSSVIKATENSTLAWSSKSNTTVTSRTIGSRSSTIASADRTIAITNVTMASPASTNGSLAGPTSVNDTITSSTNTSATVFSPTTTSVTIANPTSTNVIMANPTSTSVTMISPTNTSVPTARPTNTSVTIAIPTNTNVTIANPTNTSVTTASSTNTSVTTASPTNMSATTASPTNTSVTTASPTNMSATTASPTNTSVTVSSAISTSVTMANPTNTSVTMSSPTNTNATTIGPTNTSFTTANPTNTSVTMSSPTDTNATTTSPTNSNATMPNRTNTSVTIPPPSKTSAISNTSTTAILNNSSMESTITEATITAGSTNESSNSVSTTLPSTKFDYVVIDRATGAPCMLSTMAISMKIIYEKTDSTLGEGNLTVPKSARSNGTCNNETSHMELAWSASRDRNGTVTSGCVNTLFLNFVKNGLISTLDSVYFIVCLDEQNFPQAANNRLTVNTTKPLGLFSATANSGHYVCDMVTNITTGTIRARITNISLIAFNEEVNISSKREENCVVKAGVNKTMIMGGIAVAIIVVSAASVYSWRRRSSSYDSSTLP